MENLANGSLAKLGRGKRDVVGLGLKHTGRDRNLSWTHKRLLYAGVANVTHPSEIITVVNSKHIKRTISNDTQLATIDTATSIP